MDARLWSPVIRISTGFLNTVNDPVIGSATPSPTGASKWAGQLGKCVELTADQIRYASAIGQLYAGSYQYVLFSSSPASYTRGQVVMWDAAAAEGAYQVTVDEGATHGVSGQLSAGIVLNAVTPGNYGFIQFRGLCSVKFRGTLTNSGAVGQAIFEAAAGAGADNATADNPSTVAVSMFGRYLGRAKVAPSGGGTTLVDLNIP